MKKYLSGLLTGIIISLSITGFAAVKLTAQYSEARVKLDGNYLGGKVVSVNDGKTSKNYVSIDAIVKALNASYKWNGATKTIELTRPKPLTVEQVAKDNLNNCVLITCYKNGEQIGTGSGVIIDVKGTAYILTNKHVLDMGVEYGISYQWIAEDLEYKTKSVVQLDTDLDIGLIRSPVTPKSYAKFGDSDKVVIGNNIVLISSPGGMRNTVTNGIVSSIRTDYNMNHFQITARATPGSSGGGLFNMNGELIGLMEKGPTEEENCTIQINAIKKVLEKLQ
ncbi:MAG: serine protease [Clostridia bacterium]|nr:serine protease [Clostridia bacterium]